MTRYMYYKSLEIANMIAYAPGQMIISEYKKSDESQEYEACTFNLLNKKIIFRKAKNTPKKSGHFVTIWKRELGITVPFDDSDAFDYLIVHVENEGCCGQFVFDKAILIKQGIISSENKKGKRGMRVYSPWVMPNNKTALKSKSWQCSAFIDLYQSPDAIKKYIN